MLILQTDGENVFFFLQEHKGDRPLPAPKPIFVIFEGKEEFVITKKHISPKAHTIQNHMVANNSYIRMFLQKKSTLVLLVLFF